LRFDIVKHIIAYKIKAADVAESREKKKQNRDLILSLVEGKKVDELKEKTADELLAMLED
jgi:hypothetical protein